jgi:hypothetical protein
VHVAASQNAPLDIAELVEYEQRVIAGAAEMAVVGAAFLVAISRTFARIHVEDDGLRRSLPVHVVEPLARQIDESGKVLRPAQPLRLKTPHLASRRGRADDRPVADHPAHCRIAAQPASFKSS